MSESMLSRDQMEGLIDEVLNGGGEVCRERDGLSLLCIDDTPEECLSLLTEIP